MNKRTLPLAILSLALILSVSLSAQRNCGTMDVLESQLEEDPKMEMKMEQIEAHFMNIENSGVREVNGVVNIPVVVHVIYNNSTENISDAQVLSQIDVLNEDFRRTNSDADDTWSQATDSEIEFCMATSDPFGNATTGIVRTSTSVSAFGTNDQMKFSSSGGADAWPTSDYLNIWVCDISGGILGYAQFPGGAASTDGIVIDYQYFGTVGTASAPFDLGRTATHEVGHWLNLRHIWGDGSCSVDDFVSDTPTSNAANYGCDVGSSACGSVDMVQNYMDYSDDACMNLYTVGQRNRMRALFESGGYRSSLLNSSACGDVVAPTCDDGIQNGDEEGVDCGGSNCEPCVCDGVDVTMTLNFDNYPSETSWEIVGSGEVVASGGTYGSQPQMSTLNITQCLPEGCYTVTVFDSYGDGLCCQYGEGSYVVTDEYGNELASGASFNSTSSGNFCISVDNGPDPTCDDGIQNGNETGVDCGGDCAACPTCDDGVQNGNETGVDCGGDCAACITCDDGIQNGNETGVDCGGDCAACPTCDDGVQNGNETGVDCGGDCAACITCDDGIQNGNETGVDCGGDCAACPTCDDGVQNGNETGVDCGGDCAACITCDDGIQNGNETGIDCGGDCAACPTCDDGVQNGNETGVDCGGDCAACPTCDDGVQNGNETGIDCGGDCAACPTCDDGLQNGNETGVDCGGDCAACPTCDDGLQNGEETGIDCGGPDCEPCETGPCSYGDIDVEDFESGWGIWNDGGSDCRRNRRDRNYANGTYCVRIRDNTSTSVTYTDDLDLSGYEELTVGFGFVAKSMENGEDFVLEYSTNGGGSFTTVASYIAGSNFTNGPSYSDEVVIAGPFTANTVVQFRCDASGNNDQIYLDDVAISGCTSGGRWSAPVTPLIEADLSAAPSPFGMLNLYPNPASESIQLDFELYQDVRFQWMVTDMQGRFLMKQESEGIRGEQHINIDVSGWPAGTYLLFLRSTNGAHTKRFMIQR